MNTPELPVFNFQMLKVVNVESKLENIDVKRATGYDKIPGKLLSKAYREPDLNNFQKYQIAPYILVGNFGQLAL